MAHSRPTALVTGASGGLGAEVARVLAGEGFDLVLVARNEGKLLALENELEDGYGIHAHVCPADLSRENEALDVYDFVLEHELNVDVLVNNAGFGDSGTFHRADWARQRDMVQVNVVALMQLTRLLVPPMVERGTGMVLNLSSVAAFSAGPYMSTYYATKAYVLSFSEALHEELAGTGVTVTALCPGPTATGFESAAAMSSGSAMFRHAASAADVARDGWAAMRKGKAVCLQGAFTKAMALGSRLVPRSVARKLAMRINR
ncbi:short chain dehydrogenase [Propionibacterium ruminifibrarum]|uniref:Short chain dehydrogenase n=1 Tax=Propionibacterium ruminifibrarum TaxID=1962131 RepID=A0A375I652_9ACTN|nr:SDR family oxidoreductase [Propionibacterium ruminifibrarum]SPF68878.1 short chain dehydrogenase [Propionibacterium ruminifibrarum]